MMSSILSSLFLFFITTSSVLFDSRAFASLTRPEPRNNYDSTVFRIDAATTTTVSPAVLNDSPQLRYNIRMDSKSMQPPVTEPREPELPREPREPELPHEPREPELTSVPQVVQQPRSPAPSKHGPFLGRIGTETPAFRTKCRKCCSKSRRQFSRYIPFLKGCKACKLKKNLGSLRGCPEGTLLGYSENPEKCFWDRCHQMLIKRNRNCACYGRTKSARRAAL